jgi:haloalkane dehalogenase
VLPGLTGSAWSAAADLIGMGRSGKPDIGYMFAGHAAYLGHSRTGGGVRW